MNPSSNTSRLPWLDFASGIMILWMIIYHAIVCAWEYDIRDLWGITDAALIPEGIHAFINNEGKLEVLNPCVLFPWLHFFMPWFFYKSGQFFKKRSTKDLWKKDSQKLLKTFVIWSAIGYVFFLLFGYINDTLTLRGATYSIMRGLFLRGQIPINGPCWFLLTLFGVRFVANKLLPERGDKYTWLKIVGVVLAGYLISYLAYRFDYRLIPYWVANGAAGMSFFVLGYAMRDWDCKLLLIIPCVLVYIICCFVGFPVIDMMDNELLLGNYLFWIPVAFCCIIVFNTFCRCTYQFTRILSLEWIGMEAMVIYVVHFIIAQVVIFTMNILDVDVQSLLIIFIILIAYMLLIYFVNYILKQFKDENSIF